MRQNATDTDFGLEPGILGLHEKRDKRDLAKKAEQKVADKTIQNQTTDKTLLKQIIILT